MLYDSNSYRPTTVENVDEKGIRVESYRRSLNARRKPGAVSLKLSFVATKHCLSTRYPRRASGFLGRLTLYNKMISRSLCLRRQCHLVRPSLPRAVLVLPEYQTYQIATIHHYSSETAPARQHVSTPVSASFCHPSNRCHQPGHRSVHDTRLIYTLTSSSRYFSTSPKSSADPPKKSSSPSAISRNLPDLYGGDSASSSSAPKEFAKQASRAQAETTSFPTDTTAADEPSESHGASGANLLGAKLFDLSGKVVVVTGGGQGLGLCLAGACVEAGAIVHCLDVREEPSEEFRRTSRDLESQTGRGLEYDRLDVTDAEAVEEIIGGIGDRYGGLHGLIAAAGIQRVEPALSYPLQTIPKMLAVNYSGVYHAAVSCAKSMVKHHVSNGSLVLIASMSAFIANKGFTSSVYNSSKAAVVQLTRSLAMEWGKVIPGGDAEGFSTTGDGEVDGLADSPSPLPSTTYPIRVNALCPGNILTPMVAANFEDDPGLEALWTRENMLGRMSLPEEYRGAALFLLSERASSFMTGGSLTVDGGYTAW